MLVNYNADQQIKGLPLAANLIKQHPAYVWLLAI
jgi:hypothetical protein